MARDARDLRRLAEELAALTPEERERVIADATRSTRFPPPPVDFRPPLIKGGTWAGGDLRREDIYGDDGR
jgi:hypothetical protein